MVHLQVLGAATNVLQRSKVFFSKPTHQMALIEVAKAQAFAAEAGAPIMSIRILPQIRDRLRLQLREQTSSSRDKICSLVEQVGHLRRNNIQLMTRHHIIAMHAGAHHETVGQMMFEMMIEEAYGMLAETLAETETTV